MGSLKMSLWVTDSSSDEEEEETEEIIHKVLPPSKKRESKRTSVKQYDTHRNRQVAPSQAPSKKASDQSVQRNQHNERHRPKPNDNFSQKPAKVKKKRPRDEGLEIETNVIRAKPEEITEVNSVQTKKSISTILTQDPESQRTSTPLNQREDLSELKCLLWFILVFSVLTCGFVVFLFYQSLS